MSKKSHVFRVFSLIAVLALLLAACGGAATQAPATQPPAAEKQQVEVFSWWTGGGEAAGLDAMIVVFGQKYPEVTFVNAAVAGGAGTNARAVLATRLQASDPPDSFQGHAGQELIGTYVK
ncbi:MAG: carbohydrate ABC transporter substrate-binding protein, partial [Chloroflexota bacterium]